MTNATKVLERAQSAGLTTCVDLVSIHHPDFRRIVRSAAPCVDVLVSNEIEAAQTFSPEADLDHIRTPDALLQMARGFLDLGVRQAAVVHCVERAVWAGADGTEVVVEIAPLPSSEIASNLGAGDAFCAGLLYGIHEGLAPAKAVDIATATARASLRGLTATSAITPLASLGISLGSTT